MVLMFVTVFVFLCVCFLMFFNVSMDPCGLIQIND